jgi:RNAse H-fold protein YqgF
MMEILELKSLRRPLIGLDLGDKRIGVAVADATWLIASAHSVIQHKKFMLTAEQIFKIIDEYQAVGLVIGLPLHMDGSESRRSQSARDFGRNLQELRPGLAVFYMDERLTSVAAEETLLSADVSRKRRKQSIDKVAAAYILQTFLNQVTHKK